MQSEEQMDSVQLYFWIIEQYTVPAGVNKALLYHLSACVRSCLCSLWKYTL